MRDTSGYVYKDKRTGFWYARVTYTETNGGRKDIKRHVASKSAGYKALGTLIEQVESNQYAAIEAERMTFAGLCDFYSAHYLTPPQYVKGRKVSGLRSRTTVGGYINLLRDHFGRRKLKSVTYEDLRAFRDRRLKSPTRQSEQRSLTTVNREMAYLRRVLNIAERNGWIPKNPFKTGDPLIHVADEVRRERILTREEEARLLAACGGCKWHTRPVRSCNTCRSHLRPIIIAASTPGAGSGSC